jgi:NAD(P)-dependent dehydrogenase (short-subunit alcohol dehydrogenase family)
VTAQVARVALVTGCGKPDGAGQAVARSLARDGVAVIAADRRPTGVPNRRQEIVGSEQPASWSGLDTLVAEIAAAGGTATASLGDIGSEDDAEAMVNVALERYGRLDILVNNAAAPQGLDRAVIDEVPIEAFDEVVRINLRGTWLMCRAAVPLGTHHQCGLDGRRCARPVLDSVLGVQGGRDRPHPGAGDGCRRMGDHGQLDQPRRVGDEPLGAQH